MRFHHTPVFWVLAALVALVALLTFNEAHGQASGEANFQGRPAMAGAQAGTGAMAGPPQGGVAPQPEGAMRRRVVPDDQRRPRDRNALPRKGESGVAQPERSASRQLRRGAKNTRDTARHGVPPVSSE